MVSGISVSVATLVTVGGVGETFATVLGTEGVCLYLVTRQTDRERGIIDGNLVLANLNIVYAFQYTRWYSKRKSFFFEKSSFSECD